MPAFYSVRAIPAQGHKFRRRAGRAWTKDIVSVVVVDKPDPAATSPIEISPADLAALQADQLIAVSAQGSGDASADDLNAAKVRIGELDRMLADARKAQQQLVEELADVREGAKRAAEDGGARIAQLTADLGALRAKVAKRSKPEE
jgi:hypothetical protein